MENVVNGFEFELPDPQSHPGIPNAQFPLRR
jgi:hypothetical protein